LTESAANAAFKWQGPGTCRKSVESAHAPTNFPPLFPSSLQKPILDFQFPGFGPANSARHLFVFSANINGWLFFIDPECPKKVEQLHKGF
jgi:hypothetical protein